MAVIRDLLEHHSVTLTEKYYAHLTPSSLASAVQRLNKKENLLPKLLHKTDFAAFSGSKNGEDEPPLTGSFERCYVPEVAPLPEWRNWHTQQTQNGTSAIAVLLEALRNRLIPQKKTTSMRSSRLPDFWVIFEAF